MFARELEQWSFSFQELCDIKPFVFVRERRKNNDKLDLETAIWLVVRKILCRFQAHSRNEREIQYHAFFTDT